jgi:hypothetical protein
MSERELLDQIRTQVEELQAAAYPSASGAFCHWAMQTYFELEWDEAIEACSVGDPTGKGIDAYWQDATHRTVVLARARYAVRPKPIELGPLLELETMYSETSAATSDVRAELRTVAPRLADLRRNDPEYPVLLCFFTNGEFTVDAHEHAKAFNLGETHGAVELLLVDLKALQKRQAELNSRVEAPPSQRINIPLQRYFEFNDDDAAAEPKTVVATVNTKELAAIEREFRYRIFQRNVRYWLKATNRVNKGIAKTLGTPDGRAKFWYYNNGIAIVCDSVEVEPDPSGVGGVARVRNLQIVNGCQTTTTLGETSEFLEDPDTPAYVLVRFFEATDEELQTAISLYNNRQNAVKDRDLLSNDDPQARLQTEFAALSPSWYYERKRGEWDAKIKSDEELLAKYGNGARRIDNEVAAQAAYAFWFDPAIARARKRMLFVRKVDDDNGLYDDVFHQSTRPRWILLPFRIMQFVTAEKKSFMVQWKRAVEVPELERTNDEKRTVQRGWLRFADQLLVGATYVYLDEAIDLHSDDAQEALLRDDMFEDVIGRAYRQALRDLAPFFRNKNDEARSRKQTFDPANFVKSHWTEVEEWLRDQSGYRKDEGEDPFEGVPLP